MLTPEERLEQLESVFLELEEESKRTPIIVEGRKDEVALGLLGVKSNVVTLSKGMSIFAFCESISRTSKRAIVLTDWDKKGGRLARMLKEALNANGVEVDSEIRAKLVILSKKEVKDIEGLPPFVSRLRSMMEGRRQMPGLRYGKRI